VPNRTKQLAIKAAWALAIAAVAAVYLSRLDAPLTNYDEPIYAEFIRSMHQSGDYLTLRYRDIETVQRPPTAVALAALASKTVDGELGLRLVPALFTLLAIVFVGVFTARHFASHGAGIAAMLTYAAVPSVHLYGRLLLSDPPFVLAATAALMLTVVAQSSARALVPAAVVIGLAFAVKSFAAAVVLCALFPWWITAAWRHARAGQDRRGLGIAAFILVAGAYYAYGFATYKMAFYREHFRDLLFASARGDIPVATIGNHWAYARHLYLADSPLITVLFGVAITSCAILALKRKDAELGVLASAPMLIALILSALGTRLSHYLLVFYPAAALCVGAAVAQVAKAAGAADVSRAPLVNLLAPIVALAVFATGLAQPSFDAGAEPSPAARDLGYAAGLISDPKEPIYAVDWYCPSLGYYADRPWIFVTHREDVARRVLSAEVFRKSKAVRVVPPWPTGDFLVVGRKQQLMTDPLLTQLHLSAEAGPYALGWARATTSR